MGLKKYFGKQVKVTDIDDTEWLGKVETYTPHLDSESSEEEVGLMTDKGLLGFAKSEIQSIEIVD